MRNPPCSKWNVWIGREVEGNVARGEPTLFIRRLPPELSLAILRHRLPNIKRVWFCKEFRDWGVVETALSLFDEVCVEVAENLRGVPYIISAKARIYLKLDYLTELKTGDHVCIGLPFQDEAFEIGKGVRVTPDMYLQDEFVA